ncbi:hypothetical protein TRFO_06394 [Tritrichomonas foetus]|uniref:RING-type domain-containing protein n=1 Tax=Tritrichomonas foetus TaxID=1144522 RepID=A0A1J4K2Y4_9EUKA|nr:hypothetical protein TRFO_06394 [Tritrichomonas foetus]|eukprot:OHT04100.1 hypothetical protein TRFO_06394 [Tritrichomonas foetus]
MFHRADVIPNHFGDYKFPDSLTEDIRNKRYTNAAECMIRHNIPFNYAFIFLSNCPEALSAYIFNSIPELDDAEFMNDAGNGGEEEEEDKKEAEEGATSDEQKGVVGIDDQDEQDEPPPVEEKKPRDVQPKKAISSRSALLMNLYVAVTIPIIQTKTGKERKMDMDKMIDFCKKCKVALNKRHIYTICRELSDDDLAKSIYLIFGDIWEYSMILFEKKQYDKIFLELTKLPEQKRAQVIRRFPREYQNEMVKNWLNGELPSGTALFPFVVETDFTDQIDDQLATDLNNVLLRMYRRRLLVTPPQTQAFYHLVVRTTKVDPNVSADPEEKKSAFIYNIYDRTDLLFNIGYDFLLRHLERRHLYRFAAQVCAYEKTRHKAAITYAIKADISTVYNVLMVDLADAEDNRECWMRALARSKPENDDSEMAEWLNLLLTTATTSSYVALDDVFYLMPTTMEIDKFQPTILKTIKESQANQNASNAKITELINRSNHQRELIRIGPKLTANLDSIATCSICKNSIYSARYLVFPCNHTVHISCFMDSMHLYYDPTMRLNLISLSARAMRDEKRASGLADVICKSCPICGELSINVLSKGFTIPQEKEQASIWSLPPALSPAEEEEE